MLSSVDETIFNDSLINDLDKEYIASSRSFVSANDTNNGTYPSSIINFDVKYSADRWTSTQESFILMPITLQMESKDTNAFDTSGSNDWAMGLKNSVGNLISQFSIQINDQQINNPTPNSNYAINFELLKMSVDDVRNYQDTIMHSLDSSDTTRYYSADNACGFGECNNVIKDTGLFDPSGGYLTVSTVNKGRLERLKSTCYDPQRNPAVSYYLTQTNSIGNSYSNGIYEPKNTTLQMQWVLFCCIPLKILHPVFNSIPLCKGMRLKLRIDSNVGNSFTVSNNGSVYSSTGYVSSPVHETCPFMVSPIKGGVTPGACTSIKFSSELGNDVMKNCKFYQALYTLTPDMEKKYIADNIKNIVYTDYTMYNCSVDAGAMYNQQLTAGQTFLRSFVMYPQLNSASNFNLSPALSPFSSAPNTTACALVNSFNLSVDNKNIFEQNVQYSFEYFNEHFRPAMSLNGGVSKAMSSGLLSRYDWERFYRIVYVDLSRNVDRARDSQSKPIQLIFTNGSNVKMDYFIILSYERSFKLDILSGQLQQ